MGIVQGLSGPLRRLVLFTFAAQCWALWNIRNKLAIEGKLINNPTDALFKMSMYMQGWRVLVRYWTWLETRSRGSTYGQGTEDDGIVAEDIVLSLDQFIFML
jgi:hypothetical protein